MGSRQVPAEPEGEIEGWITCAERLLLLSGKQDRLIPELIKLYGIGSIRKDNEFMTYLISLIYVESRFNKWAVSHANAYGLTQVTEVAIQDAGKYCKINRKPKDIHDSVTNVKYGSCYLSKLFIDVAGDWTSTLIAYNGGYKQLTRYQKGEQIDPETANYVLQINRTRQICLKK